jgi:hypothetical protein
VVGQTDGCPPATSGRMPCLSNTLPSSVGWWRQRRASVDAAVARRCSPPRDIGEHKIATRLAATSADAKRADHGPGGVTMFSIVFAA